MEDIGKTYDYLSAPNLINICVDQYDSGEISGRMYHCYSEEPTRFKTVVELVREAEKLYDAIGFPQASTKTRSLLADHDDSNHRKEKPEKKMMQEELLRYQGEAGTFFVVVKYRQNSTWQGGFFKPENKQIHPFQDVLEFMKLLESELR